MKALRIPITGYIAVEVTAEDEVRAKELTFATETPLDDVEEWELQYVLEMFSTLC